MFVNAITILSLVIEEECSVAEDVSIFDTTVDSFRVSNDWNANGIVE